MSEIFQYCKEKVDNQKYEYGEKDCIARNVIVVANTLNGQKPSIPFACVPVHKKSGSILKLTSKI